MNDDINNKKLDLKYPLKSIYSSIFFNNESHFYSSDWCRRIHYGRKLNQLKDKEKENPFKNEKFSKRFIKKLENKKNNNNDIISIICTEKWKCNSPICKNDDNLDCTAMFELNILSSNLLEVQVKVSGKHCNKWFPTKSYIQTSSKYLPITIKKKLSQTTPKKSLKMLEDDFDLTPKMIQDNATLSQIGRNFSRKNRNKIGSNEYESLYNKIQILKKDSNFLFFDFSEKLDNLKIDDKLKEIFEEYDENLDDFDNDLVDEEIEDVDLEKIIQNDEQTENVKQNDEQTEENNEKKTEEIEKNNFYSTFKLNPFFESSIKIETKKQTPIEIDEKISKNELELAILSKLSFLILNSSLIKKCSRIFEILSLDGFWKSFSKRKLTLDCEKNIKNIIYSRKGY
jgi:hypothetical protein